jgi:hypothetical protein
MRKGRFRRALGVGLAAFFLMAGVLAWAAPASAADAAEIGP